MLFEEPGGQFASEGGDTGFALVEGDELRLLVVVEEEVEGGLGLLQPLRAEAFTLGRCQGGVHGAISGCPRKRTDAPAILPLNPPRRNGDAPNPGSRLAGRGSFVYHVVNSGVVCTS